jgi:hypothetical protein
MSDQTRCPRGDLDFASVDVVARSMASLPCIGPDPDRNAAKPLTASRCDAPPRTIGGEHPHLQTSEIHDFGELFGLISWIGRKMHRLPTAVARFVSVRRPRLTGRSGISNALDEQRYQTDGD